MKKIFILITISIFIVSCNRVEKEVQGGWVIDQAYYYDEPVIWDLYGNGMSLRKDKTCHLPAISEFHERTPEEETGTWKVFKKDNISYLEIKTHNWIFNRTFEIQNLRKVQDSISWGYLMKMTLMSDSLKLDCTRPIY